MKTIWKIVIACFVGGVLCSAVALKFSPNFWWLGLLAGFAGGYLSYEFREVLVAIRQVWHKELNPFGDDSLQPRPFVHFSMLTGLAITCLLELKEVGPFAGLGVVSFTGLCTLAVSWTLSGALLSLFAYVGADSEKCRWWSRISQGSDCYKSMSYYKSWREFISSKYGGGYHEGAISYANVSRWIMKGIPLSIWYAIVIPLKLTWLFAREVFLKIHSEKRLLCAVDGTLGGAVSYLILASHTQMFQEKLVLVFFGGLLGAMFGVLNYEVVSKRILRLVHARN